MIGTLVGLFRRPAALTATEAQKKVNDGAVLLDVRDLPEWRAGHAPQARHLPLGDLRDRLTELPTDTPVVAVCRSGRRSAIAARLLTRHGYTASNLTGGMHAWVAAGLPIVTQRNRPGQIN
jgi:rhodanese-related sulfurtransferase